VGVGAQPREGEQFNTASAAGTLSNGERVFTPRARAGVRVRRGLFSSQQVLIGRVYADANLNGQFDQDERGVPGVRLYLNNGQSVLTDSEGLYNFPVLNEGAQVLSLDPVTLPPGYALVETGRRDERSWTRLLRTPLGGGALLRQNYGLRAPDSASISTANVAQKNSLASSSKSPLAGSLFGSTEAKNPSEAKPEAKPATPVAAGTYETTTEETLEPVAPGEVRVL
jgi:hypothetical protein